MFGLLELMLVATVAAGGPPLLTGWAPVAQSPSSAPAAPATGPILGLHGLPSQQADRRDARRRSTSIASSCSSRHVFGSPAIRQRARDRARRRRGAGRGRRAGARAGVSRFSRHAGAELPRRHAARAGRHHQRASRAAGVPRRRAAVRRHGDRADHLVRRRGRRPRRISGGASAIAPTRWRRSTRRRSAPRKGFAAARSTAARRRSATSR